MKNLKVSEHSGQAVFVGGHRHVVDLLLHVARVRELVQLPPLLPRPRVRLLDGLQQLLELRSEAHRVVAQKLSPPVAALIKARAAVRRRPNW